MSDSEEDEQPASAIPFLVRANAWLRTRLGRSTELGSALRSSEDGRSTDRKAIIRTAPVFAMGHKVYNAREVETIILKTELAQQFSHNIDLAPTENVHEVPHFSDKQKGVIAREYLVRYLEHIGAAPTEANIQNIQKHLPKSKLNIQHNPQSSGHNRDHITITNTNQTTQVEMDKDRPTHLRDGEYFTFASGILSRREFRRAQRLNQSWRFGKTELPQPGLGVPSPLLVYNDLKHVGKVFDPTQTYHNWLRNFNPKKRKLVLPNLGQLSEHAKMIQRDVEQKAKSEKSKELAQMADVYYTSHQPVAKLITDELSQPFTFTKQSVIDELALFNRTFPFHEIGHSITEADIQFAMYEIASMRVVNLISKTCRFLYLVVVSNEPQGSKEKQQALFTKMQALYSEQLDRMHTRTDVVVVLPLILYAVRVVTEAIFSRVYPRWTLTSEGAATLAEIDRLVLSVFDPSSYHAEIASPYAATQLKSQTYKQKTLSEAVRNRRKHLSAQFRTVSPMVQALLTNPGSVATRSFLRDDSKYSTLKPKENEKSEFYPDLEDTSRLKGTLANGKRNVNRFTKVSQKESFLDSTSRNKLYGLATLKVNRDATYYERLRAGQREVLQHAPPTEGRPWERFGRARAVGATRQAMEDSDEEVAESESDDDVDDTNDPERTRLRNKWSTLRGDLLGDTLTQNRSTRSLRGKELSGLLAPGGRPRRSLHKSSSVSTVRHKDLRSPSMKARATDSPTSDHVSDLIQSPSQRTIGVEIATRDSSASSRDGDHRARIDIMRWEPRPPSTERSSPRGRQGRRVSK